MKVLARKRRREWLPEPPKDKYFVAPVILSQFYRSNVVFEDFKKLKSQIGWQIEPVRFANCTNTRYMNLHHVRIPKYHVYPEAEFLIGFGRILPKVLHLVYRQEKYAGLPILFFHMSVCDKLTVYEIEYRIFEFVLSNDFLPKKVKFISEGLIDRDLFDFDELETIKIFKPRWSDGRANGNNTPIRNKYLKVMYVKSGVVRNG